MNGGQGNRPATARIAAFVGAVMIAAPALAAQPRLGTGAAPDVAIVRILVALLLCLAIAVAAILLLRRRGAGMPQGSLRQMLGALTTPGARRIEIVEARRATPQLDICLVRHDDREFLIACSQQQLLLLSEVPAAAAIPSTTGPAA